MEQIMALPSPVLFDPNIESYLEDEAKAICQLSATKKFLGRLEMLARTTDCMEGKKTDMSSALQELNSAQEPNS